MSNEVYLKGEKKLQAISIIKTGLAVRMKSSEILQQLAKKGIEISERTLRRLKLEIYEDAGGTILDIFKNQVGGRLFDQVLSFEEMERQCWELFFQAKTPQDKLRAITQLRMISQDKMKIAKPFHFGFRSKKIEYTQIRDDLKEFEKEGDSETS